MASPNSVTPKVLARIDYFTLPERDPNLRVSHFLSYANGRAYRGRFERLT
jgi:hypothetical protein